MIVASINNCRKIEKSGSGTITVPVLQYAFIIINLISLQKKSKYILSLALFHDSYAIIDQQMQ